MGLLDLFKKKETIVEEKRVMGDALMKAGRYQEAIQAYDQAINLNPQDAFLCCKKGDVLLKMKRYDEAIQTYNQAIKIYPHFGNAYGSRGHVFLELGRYEEAKLSYWEAGNVSQKTDDRLHCEKDHRGCYYGCVSHFHSFMENKCDQLMKMGKYEEAIKAAYDGLYVPGDHYYQYVNYVSDSLKKMGKHKEVEYVLRKYLEAEDLLDQYRYEDAYALMHMCIGYLIKCKLNIKELA